MTETNEESVDKLVTQLFCQSDNLTFSKNGINRFLAFCLLACQLMYLKCLEQCHPPNQENIIVKVIVDTAEEIGITKDTLYDWGDKVRSRYKLAVDRAHEIAGIKGTLEKNTAALQNLQASLSKISESHLAIENLTSIVKEYVVNSQAQITSLSNEVKFMRTFIEENMASTKMNCSLNVTSNATMVSSLTSSQVSEKQPSQTQDLTQDTTSKNTKDVNSELTQGEKDKKNNADFGRFNSGNPQLMSCANFAAKVLIYDKRFDVHGRKPFTFDLKSRSAKGRFRKVIERIRSHLSDEEKRIAPGRIGQDNRQIFDMFIRAQAAMVVDVHQEYKRYKPEYKVPARFKEKELQVFSIATRIEDTNALKNKMSSQKTTKAAPPNKKRKTNK